LYQEKRLKIPRDCGALLACENFDGTEHEVIGGIIQKTYSTDGCTRVPK
jgi:hypothetical protein